MLLKPLGDVLLAVHLLLELRGGQGTGVCRWITLASARAHVPIVFVALCVTACFVCVERLWFSWLAPQFESRRLDSPFREVQNAAFVPREEFARARAC